MKLYWYYSTVWPIMSWGHYALTIRTPPQEIPGIGLVYAIVAYEAPLHEEKLLGYGLVPMQVDREPTALRT
jgi:hypothetical protein